MMATAVWTAQPAAAWLECGSAGAPSRGGGGLSSAGVMISLNRIKIHITHARAACQDVKIAANAPPSCRNFPDEMEACLETNAMPLRPWMA